ncbi:HAD family hydrolase [Dongia deserti]|uniref:HAD family hydrolase n=1 Tax=Dongia deserti TaxID=2268030 RepID=UPI000E647558|nr:HAD family hydrolase [Dongia deserti]
MRGLTTIGFDADDTLWHSERVFRLTEERFAALLADYVDSEGLSQRLLETERRNLDFYGFGRKGFVLSMIETAIDVTDGKVPTSVLKDLIDLGRDMAAHPIEILPNVRETLHEVAERYRILLITKGDLLDQEQKLARSGLGELFQAVEIVSDKSPATYQRIFARHGDGPERSVMVGNSLKSDVVPAIEAGGWGIFIPHPLTWALEHVEAPMHAPRFRQIERIGELPALLASIES